PTNSAAPRRSPPTAGPTSTSSAPAPHKTWPPTSNTSANPTVWPPCSSATPNASTCRAVPAKSRPNRSPPTSTPPTNASSTPATPGASSHRAPTPSADVPGIPSAVLHPGGAIVESRARPAVPRLHGHHLRRPRQTENRRVDVHALGSFHQEGLVPDADGSGNLPRHRVEP